jgi:hypothetical protein
VVVLSFAFSYEKRKGKEEVQREMKTYPRRSNGVGETVVRKMKQER